MSRQVTSVEAEASLSSHLFSDDTERALAEIWSELLSIPLEDIKPSDSFLDLGGALLSIPELLLKIEKYSIFKGLKVYSLFLERKTLAQAAVVLKSKRSRFNQFQFELALKQPAQSLSSQLSFQQETIWFHLQTPGIPQAIYNESSRMTFYTEVDVGIFKSALALLVQRHSILTCSIHQADGIPFQRLNPQRELPVQVVDLSHLTDVSERDSILKALIFAECEKPFDLELDTLCKFILIRLSTKLTEVVVVTHHLIVDGVGFLVLPAELSYCYEYCESGQTAPIPPVPLQYFDFARCQRECFRKSDNSDLSSYWKAQLNGMLPLDLPTDYKRQSAGNKLTCDRYLFHFRPEITTLIRASSATFQQTPFVLLSTAVNILLSRYTDQDDISILTARHGRNHPSLKEILGHFVNILIIRNRVDPSLSFRQLLSSVQQSLLMAYEHEDFPFQHVFSQLSLKQEEKSDFLRVLVSMVPRQPESQGKGVTQTFDYLNVKMKYSKYDMVFFFEDQGDKFRGCIEYNSDLYTLKRIERMREHFQNVLEQGLKFPNSEIKNINLLSQAEIKTISSFSNSDRALANNFRTCTLLDLFEAQLKRRPGSVAVSVPDEGLELTYQALNEEAERICGRLAPKLSQQEQIVAVLLPNGPDLIASTIGIFKLGRACLQLGVDNPVEKLKFMMEDMSSPIVISRQKILAGLGFTYDRTLLLDSLLSLPDISVDRTVSFAGSAHDLAYAIYTSGTTGTPKAALLEHFSLVGMVDFFQNQFNTSATAKTLLFTNPAFDVSIAEIWPCLASGGTLVCPPAELRFNVSDLRVWVKDQDVTTICMTTGLAEAFCTAEPAQFSTALRWVIPAGEALSLVPGPEVPFQVVNCYGVTEASVYSSFHLVPATETVRPIPIGKPLPHVRIYILDSCMQQCPVGVDGELYIGGPSVAREYHGRTELTQAKFLSYAKDRVYKTGDIGRWLDDGNICLKGRSDFQIKIRGFRLELGEVEEAIRSFPNVQGVVAVKDGRLDQIHAFLIMKSHDDIPVLPELRKYLSARLPTWAIPSAFHLLSDFPRTANGKVDRARLLTEFKTTVNLCLSEVESVLSSLGQCIAKIWAEMFDVPLEQIGGNTNFFELGGNSILIAMFIQRLRQEQNSQEFPKLDIATIFSYSTLADLAEELELRQKSPTWLVESIKKKFTEYLDEDLLLGLDSAFVDPSATGSAILLTGATGYLGSQLLFDLIESSGSSQIYCIVRAKSNAEAFRRIATTLNSYKLHIDDSILSTRVRCFAGDLSKFQFGLESDDYVNLAGSVCSVYHCAAEVHVMKHYRDLRGTNVQGTKRVIHFVTERTGKELHYISTLGVFEVDQAGRFDEVELTGVATGADEQLAYSQSKWVAEKLVWTAITKGVRAKIYRPGLIGCSSERNIVNETDALALVLRYCHQLGSYPELNWISPYGTVEFTSRAIISISQQSSDYGQVYNIFQNTLSFKELLGLSKADLKPVGLEEWQSLCDNSSIDPASSEFVKELTKRLNSSIIVDNKADDESIFSNSKTVNALSLSGTEFSAQENWVERYYSLIMMKKH